MSTVITKVIIGGVLEDILQINIKRTFRKCPNHYTYNNNPMYLRNPHYQISIFNLLEQDRGKSHILMILIQSTPPLQSNMTFLILIQILLKVIMNLVKPFLISLMNWKKHLIILMKCVDGSEVHYMK